MKKIKVYLSARVSKDAHKWNKYVCDSLKYPIKVFMPQKIVPWTLSHKDFPKQVYDACLEAMEESDLCLLLPSYGRDCAWEIGWFTKSKKPIIIFVDTQVDWLRDWMVKGGINYVITTNQKTWKILSKDPILSQKQIVFIEDISQITQELIKIYWRAKNVKKSL